MNSNIQKIIDLIKVSPKQAMELVPYVPGSMEAILKHAVPGSNPELRRIFLNAARNPETDPEILHSIGTRDLPTKIRFAVIKNPSTPRKTIEKMARQTANDHVTRRAQNFLSRDPMSEVSRLRLTVRKLIKEYFLL